MSISKDRIENFGRPPLSPYMIGEQAETTAAPIQGAMRAEDLRLREGSPETWSEPNVMIPSRSMNTVVFQSKRGGNSIVVNDEDSEGNGYMLITHRSGAAVQITSEGTVLIKSFGDTYNTSEGYQYQRSAGDTNMNVGGEWNVMVEGGSGNVYINGDLNIECENFNLKARGKATMSSGEGIEMKGAKFSMEAHSDNLDLIAKNIKLGASETFSLVSTGDMSLGTEGNLNLKGMGEVRVDATGELKLAGSETKVFGSTVYLDDVVRMAEGGAGATGVEDPVTPSVVEVEDPPARRPSMDADRDIRTVRNRPVPLTGRELDEDTPI